MTKIYIIINSKHLPCNLLRHPLRSVVLVQVLIVVRKAIAGCNHIKSLAVRNMSFNIQNDTFRISLDKNDL